MGGFDLALIKDVGAVGILLVIILMVARGALVPRRTVDSLLAEKEKAIDFLRDGLEKRELALNETIPMLEASVKNHETTVKLMTGLQTTVDKLNADKDMGR